MYDKKFRAHGMKESVHALSIRISVVNFRAFLATEPLENCTSGLFQRRK